MSNRIESLPRDYFTAQEDAIATGGILHPWKDNAYTPKHLLLHGTEKLSEVNKARLSASVRRSGAYLEVLKILGRMGIEDGQVFLVSLKPLNEKGETVGDPSILIGVPHADEPSGFKIIEDVTDKFKEEHEKEGNLGMFCFREGVSIQKETESGGDPEKG